MDYWEEVEEILFLLMDTIDDRIQKYEKKCPAKKNLERFYGILEQLKMPVGQELHDECIAILKPSLRKIRFRKARWETAEDYKSFKKTITTQWQRIQFFLLNQDK